MMLFEGFMRKKFLKFQFSLFGGFSFPATTDTTIMLLQAYIKEGMMPQVTQTVDVASGVQVPRITLTKGDLAMYFADGRVDIVEGMPPADRTTYQFIRTVKGLLASMPQNEKKLSRIAFVSEYLYQDPSADERKTIASLVAPLASDSSPEWTSRWTDSATVNTELIHVTTEVSLLEGFVMATGRLEAIKGIKCMHDISTSAINAEQRFNIESLDAEIEILTSQFDSSMASLPFGK